MTAIRTIVRALALAAALLSSAAFAAATAGLGEDDTKNVRAVVERLGYRMSDLGNELSREFDRDAWLEESRGRLDIADEDLRSLHVAFVKAHREGGRAGKAMKDVIADAEARYGEACARWLAEKNAEIESLNERMGALGTELSAAVEALTANVRVGTDDAHRVAEAAQADARRDLAEALSRLKVDRGAGLSALLALSAHQDRDRGERSADEVREEVRAALSRSMDEMRRALEEGEHRSAHERAKVAEALKKLADERGALDAAREQMRRAFTEQHAEHARQLAKRLARDAEANVQAAEALRRARDVEAKARVREMEKVEREKALSKRKSEKGALDEARAEIERLRRQIAELESRLRQLERSRRGRDV